jgi:hypothetical protein
MYNKKDRTARNRSRLDAILQEASSLVEDVRANPSDLGGDRSAGFRLAFGDYIERHALSLVPIDQLSYCVQLSVVLQRAGLLLETANKSHAVQP